MSSQLTNSIQIKNHINSLIAVVCEPIWHIRVINDSRVDSRTFRICEFVYRWANTRLKLRKWAALNFNKSRIYQRTAKHTAKIYNHVCLNSLRIYLGASVTLKRGNMLWSTEMCSMNLVRLYRITNYIFAGKKIADFDWRSSVINAPLFLLTRLYHLPANNCWLVWIWMRAMPCASTEQ